MVKRKQTEVMRVMSEIRRTKLSCQSSFFDLDYEQLMGKKKSNFIITFYRFSLDLSKRKYLAQNMGLDFDFTRRLELGNCNHFQR